MQFLPRQKEAKVHKELISKNINPEVPGVLVPVWKIMFFGMSSLLKAPVFLFTVRKK